MIVTANKMAVIEAWNNDRPSKVDELAMACMWEARATIVNTVVDVIDIAAVKASTDRNFIKAEIAKTNRFFERLLKHQSERVYQQMTLLPEYDHAE